MFPAVHLDLDIKKARHCLLSCHDANQCLLGHLEVNHVGMVLTNAYFRHLEEYHVPCCLYGLGY